jgi:Tol biopolymer transport system component
MTQRPLPFRPLRKLLFALSIAALAGCGQTTKVVEPGGGDTGGTHLVVYASDRNQPAGQFDLYLYDLDAGGFRLIRNISSATAPDLNPCLTSDGLLIAFQSNRGGPTNSDILLYSRFSQQLIDLPGVNTNFDEIEPAFTGDATKLAFVRDSLGLKHIRMVDGVGDTLIPLPGLDAPAGFSDWSPSPDQTGGLIAFVSDRNGNPDVFVWNASLKKVLTLSDLVSAGNDVDPSLTADGRFLCFASDRSGGKGGYDLYLYNLPLQQLVALPDSVNGPANERHPSIAGGGDVIVFQSDRPNGLGKWDIWNCRRSTKSVGQGRQQSSTSDDIDPMVLYP